MRSLKLILTLGAAGSLVMAGVRPSSGAATLERRIAPENLDAPDRAGVAAPGDGRTPALTNAGPAQPQTVFGGGPAKISTVWRNDDTNEAVAEVRVRIYQASSATAAPISVRAWKRLKVLPGQTVLESATLDFPAVTAETRFIIQWLENTNRLLGTTEVLAYPSDLLKQLRAVRGDEPLGVLDPQNQLAPLLKAAGVESADVAETGFADFRGKLAIIGPFQSKSQMPEELRSRVRALAQRGTAVVWIQPPSEPRAKMKPCFCIVAVGKGTVVVAQGSLFADLANSPAAQLNLIRLAELALRPEPFGLPDYQHDNE